MWYVLPHRLAFVLERARHGVCLCTFACACMCTRVLAAAAVVVVVVVVCVCVSLCVCARCACGVCVRVCACAYDNAIDNTQHTYILYVCTVIPIHAHNGVAHAHNGVAHCILLCPVLEQCVRVYTMVFNTVSTQ